MDEQTSIHSLQMYTAGPAISFLTSEWLFPQKEHIVRFGLRAIEWKFREVSCFYKW